MKNFDYLSPEECFKRTQGSGYALLTITLNLDNLEMFSFESFLSDLILQLYYPS